MGTLALARLFPYKVCFNITCFEWNIRTALLTHCHHMNSECADYAVSQAVWNKKGHCSSNETSCTNNRSNDVEWKKGELNLTQTTSSTFYITCANHLSFTRGSQPFKMIPSHAEAVRSKNKKKSTSLVSQWTMNTCMHHDQMMIKSWSQFYCDW